MKSIEELEAIRRVQAEKENIRIQVNNLKKSLEASDYKIIKYHEYVAAGLEPPYDIAELHAAREALRVQIRELQQD